MFKFDSVNAALLTTTETVWMAYAKERSSQVSVSYYEGCFAGCRRHVNGMTVVGDNASAIFGVFPIDAATKNIAAALVSVMHARPKSDDPYLKILTVYVEPQLNVADEEPDHERLAWIAATAIVGALSLTYEEMPAHELKIYGNVPLTKTFLSSVSTALFKDHADKFDVTGHGNWLVVKKK